MSLHVDPEHALSERHEINSAPSAAAVAAFPTKSRSYLRRWAIAGAIVVLLHGAVVATLVTWRKTMPFGPIAIRLSPAPPVAVEIPATAPPPAREQDKSNVAPNQPTEKAEDKIQQAPPRGEDSAAQKPAEQPRVTAPPAANAERENQPEPGAAPGGAPAAANTRPSSAEPIDLAIAEQRRLRFDKAAKANGPKKDVLGRPLKSFAGGQARGARAPGTTVRNALGLPVQIPGGARGIEGLPGDYRSLQPGAALGAPRNAIGAPAGMAKNTFGPVASPVVKPIDLGAGNRAGAIGANRSTSTDASILRSAAGSGAAAGAAPPGTAINGTSMTTRRGAGAAVIGGPAKNTGVLNGTGFKSGHP